MTLRQLVWAARGAWDRTAVLASLWCDVSPAELNPLRDDCRAPDMDYNPAVMEALQRAIDGQ